jgi:ribosomal protein L28
MARICDTCGRGSNRANNRSHSNVATKREQHVNLQTRKLGGVKAKICTRCIKTFTKMAA